MEGERPIKHFTDLIAWQKGFVFVKLVYSVAKNFPVEEQFGLTSQLKRAAISIIANIAEGYGRFHYKDRVRFYYQARGSNTECQNHIILAREFGYITEEEYCELKIAVFESYKVLCGLINCTKE